MTPRHSTPDTQSLPAAAVERVENNPKAEPGGAPAVLRRLDNFLADAPTEVDWLIDGLLPMASLSLWIAKTKVGKSKLLRCMTAAVAGDRDTYLGRPIKTGPVMYLALDEGQYTVAQHYRQIATHPETMYVYCGLAFQLGEDPSFRLKQWIEVNNPVLVVIDTLFDFFGDVENVNDYQPIREAMTDLLALAHGPVGPHIAVACHANKGKGSRGDEALGSTALTGKAENIFSMKIKGDHRIVHAWGRDIEEVDDLVITLDDKGWADSAGSTKEIRDRELGDAIADAIEESGTASSSEIFRKVGGNRQQLLRRIVDMNKDGFIESISGNGRAHDPYRYRNR